MAAFLVAALVTVRDAHQRSHVLGLPLLEAFERAVGERR
jgi:hypothetical protein